MGRNKIFDPDPLFQDFRTEDEKANPRPGDRRDGKVYGYTEPLVLAINVALATARPLLLRGQAGCGKSSMAYNLARCLQRCYFETVVNSRMEARDLLWRFDAVRRLGEAQVRNVDGSDGSWKSPYPYIEPSVLWWIFDEDSAGRRGLPEEETQFFAPAKPPVVYRPSADTPLSKSIILLDEIDKAEPDVPNNLLVALGSMQFRVDEVGLTVNFREADERALKPEEAPLVIITTNEERQLPPAFLRRCVVYRFGDADKDRLIEIAQSSEGREGEKEQGLYERVAGKMLELAKKEAGGGGRETQVSIAEYLDAVRACRRLAAIEDDKLLAEIIERTTWKQPSRD